MATRRQRNDQRSTRLEQPGFYATVRQRLSGGVTPGQRHYPRLAPRYTLVRQESVMLGMTTAPFPNFHETVVKTSDSFTELSDLRDRITGKPAAGGTSDLPPNGWSDTVPERNKVIAYVIREQR